MDRAYRATDAGADEHQDRVALQDLGCAGGLAVVAGLRRDLRCWELPALILLLLFALILRMVGLGVVPPGLRYDELQNYRMAERVLAGERPLYFAESWGHEPLFHYVQAGALALAGHSDWSLRLAAVWFGLLSVVATWRAARRLLGGRVALFTAAGLAAAFWAVFYSRVGLRVLAVTPFHCLAVYLFARGLRWPSSSRSRALLEFSAAGVFLGIAFYVYPASRLMPILPLALGAYLACFHRAQFRQAWPGLLLVIVVAVAVAGPLLVVVYGDPGTEVRGSQLIEASPVLAGRKVGDLAGEAMRALGMFIWDGDQDWLYNVQGRPVFDPLTAGCFFLGLLVSLRRWRDVRYALLLGWFAIGLMPNLLLPPATSFSHAIATQPAAYILLGVGLEVLWSLLARRSRPLALATVGFVLALHGTVSAGAYFITWARAPEVQELYQGGVTAVARELDAGQPPGPVVIGAPYANYWHPWNVVGFDLALRREDFDVRWFNPAGAWVWPAGERPVTYYFPVDPLGPQSFDPQLWARFAAAATVLPTESPAFAAFRVESPVALGLPDTSATPVLGWPPGWQEAPRPELPLVFGGRLALTGIELEEARAEPGGEVRLVTYWEVLAVDPAPVVAFVHLTTDGQDIWGQVDWLDVWPEGLQPGDRFVQIHRVPIKPEAPSGAYHLQLGLYRPDTLERLSISMDDHSRADRVWVGVTIIE